MITCQQWRNVDDLHTLLTLADFQAGLSVVTAVCCDGPEHECQAGVPLRCDDRDQCSAALLPFRNEPSLLLPCTVATGSKFYERL
jgi:hypothetical protein